MLFVFFFLTKLAEIDVKFEELLSEYEITENGNQMNNLEDRMKTLQNELTRKYLDEHDIPVESLWALDQVTGYVDLSLTERFSVLEAVVKVTLDGDPDFEDLTTRQDKKIEFLLTLQDQLHVSNPTLAGRVLVNVLQITSQLTQAGKESLGLILFNNIWTPAEIKLFIGSASSMDQEEVTRILHKACTYRLSCELARSALHHYDPVSYIQDHVLCEADKDIYAVLAEIEDKNYSEDVASQLGYVLQYVAEVLPSCQGEDITDKMIRYGIRMMVSLDSSEPHSYCETLKEILILLSMAVKKCTTFTTRSGEEVPGYFPRLTQLASLLLLLLPQEQERQGCLLEIGTGEGKTCVLAMFATIQAVRGTAVDVVTSSPVLALRDQEEWKELYAMFGVTSSTVPPSYQKSSSVEDHDKLLEDAYRKQVVYGTVSTFAADILKQEFEKTSTRGGRKFECVVVDEVDYMTLDSGVQVTFLSHQASGLRHVEQVLASIWAVVSACRPIEMFASGEIQWTTRIQCFHKAAKQSVIGSESEDFSENDVLLLGAEMGFYSQQDVDECNKAMSETENGGTEDEKWKAIEKIMVKVGPKEQHELLCELQRKISNVPVVDCYSLLNNKAQVCEKENPRSEPDVRLLLLQNGRTCEIMSEKELIDTTVDTLTHRIRYSSECSLDSAEESKGSIVIPSFLKEYIENQLPIFAENALKAILMTPGREYMIDRSPEGDRAASTSDHHQYDAIIPVDFQASGVLEKNKRWGDGLQQFLEMKHQLALSQLSTVTNYMSNVQFFKRYLSGKGIFGVSGTLGGEADKAFLGRQYKTAIYVVPAHRHNKLVELPAVQVTGGNAEWIQVICETAWRAADVGQVVLIICEDVKTADELKTKMRVQERRPDQITMYTISERHNIEKQNFGQGTIIIATNLGGRGTDIHVQEEVNECGGLFVLLTYFPGSQRVERQAFGRTARKGNPGMVQMILSQNQLATAYQGHSIETMRQLREENEVSCLDSRERNELFEIEMKERLFSIFCEFLCHFDGRYTQEEKMDIVQKRFRDIPECFKSYQEKFDYQTALGALKESWAFWLILHEQHISRHDDINTLSEDLLKHLKETASRLLHGRSSNFYDYSELAQRRTDIHRIKKKNDYGALRYWQRAAACDPFYSAVALYNQAYITMNMQKDNYITEAKSLLEKCLTAVDVYLTESTNTMTFCNLSVTKDFTPHHSISNLQTQIMARMNVFKSWKGYIESALKSLEQIKGSKGEAIAEDSSVYSLSTNKDHITTKELIALDEVGLCIVFEVKKKPEFSIDALLCCGLGLLQVAAGVLVCALSYGSACQFGLGLISEGVSDMISGFKGILQGGFDWAQWAISKAISIGVSLVFGGLSRIKRAVSAVRSGAKGLIVGAKSASVITTKQCFKQAGKYAVQEVAKQGCVTALNYAADVGLRAFFKKVLENFFNKKASSMIRANRDLDKVLTDYICSGVSKTAMEQQFTQLKIEEFSEKQMRQSVHEITTGVIPSLTMGCTQFCQVQNTLSELFGSVIQHVEDKQVQKGLQTVIKTLEMSKYVAQLIQSFPTEFVINQNFVPQLLTALNHLPQVKDEQDERHQLPEVKRLKNEFMNIIAESVSHSFVESCSALLCSLTTRMCMGKINSAAGSAVSNLLDRADTQSFFDNQLYKHQMKEAIQHPPPVAVSEADEDLDRYIEEISDVNRPATSLDIHVLTESDALQGRSVRVITVDQHGNKLSEDYYQGKNSSADDIVLQLTKDPEHSHQ